MTYHASPQHATDHLLYGSLVSAGQYLGSDVNPLNKAAGADRNFADSAKKRKTQPHPSHVLLATAGSTQTEQ